jgi:hypothetical protein
LQAAIKEDVKSWAEKLKMILQGNNMFLVSRISLTVERALRIPLDLTELKK